MNILFSTTFPYDHPRGGHATFFKEKIWRAINNDTNLPWKIHTIRKNYDYWYRQINSIKNSGYLSLRTWDGRPYHSRQIEFARISGLNIGVQELTIKLEDGELVPYIDGMLFDCWCDFVMSLEDPLTYIARNDGLSLQDWINWFRPGKFPITRYAIIHFTDFRY